MNATMKTMKYAVAGLALSWSAGALALVLGPSDAQHTVTGSPNPALDAGDVASIFGTSDLTLLYKSNYGGSEEGSFLSSYTTQFTGDPNNALITWDGPDYILCPECYLVVKDGNQPQYLFDLGSWDGQEVLDLRDFYPNQGAISHVAIFGKPVSVTEPGTLGLMGLGILGLMTVRRKAQKNA